MINDQWSLSQSTNMMDGNTTQIAVTFVPKTEIQRIFGAGESSREWIFIVFFGCHQVCALVPQFVIEWMFVLLWIRLISAFKRKDGICQSWWKLNFRYCRRLSYNLRLVRTSLRQVPQNSTFHHSWQNIIIVLLRITHFFWRKFSYPAFYLCECLLIWLKLAFS